MQKLGPHVVCVRCGGGGPLMQKLGPHVVCARCGGGGPLMQKLGSPCGLCEMWWWRSPYAENPEASEVPRSRFCMFDLLSVWVFLGHADEMVRLVCSTKPAVHHGQAGLNLLSTMVRLVCSPKPAVHHGQAGLQP